MPLIKMLVELRFRAGDIIEATPPGKIDWILFCFGVEKKSESDDFWDDTFSIFND